MNLNKLFDMQKVLRDRINYNEPDRFNKLILALLVELGECANEWRGFKFWSQDQEPHRYIYGGLDEIIKQPLLEEYVDGLHFVLEIGIEIYETDFKPTKLISLVNDINGQFTTMFKLISNLDLSMLLIEPNKYRVIVNNYLCLGENLGFTWEQIEQAYIEKNEVNHQRQETGY